MIYGTDTLRDAMNDEYFSIEEERSICSHTFTEGIRYINRDKKLKWNASKLTGRLESLDVFSRYPLEEPGPLWILLCQSLETLIASSPGSLPGSGVIGASIYGRLSLGGRVIRTYTLSLSPDGSLPLAICWFGGRGLAQIYLGPGLMSDPYVQSEKPSPTS